MRAGQCSELPTWERPTAGNVSSCWPTAKSTDGSKGAASQVNGKGKVDSLPGAAAMWPGPTARDYRSGMANRAERTAGAKGLKDVVAAQNWPTPDAMVAQDGETPATFLPRQAALKAQHKNGNGCGTPLAMAVQIVQWATPSAADWKSGTGWNHAASKSAEHTPQLRHICGGKLNPRWVSQLQGWPTEWMYGPQVEEYLNIRGKRRAPSRTKSQAASRG